MNEITVQDQFRALVRSTDTQKAIQEDVQALHRLLDILGSQARQVRDMIINKTDLVAASRELTQAEYQQMDEELGLAEAPNLEKLLIEQIALCNLRLYVYENAYGQLFTGKPGLTIAQVRKWEKDITSAQQRYIRAIEALARVRKLGIKIQVNVATNGGQQINLNG